MSEPKLISPLLDGFAMGNPMSDHDGILCCPAIKENSDKKYIVKIISVPASQKQLDALLLAGAYKDPADAMDYFKEQADGVAAEAETLQKLSRLEGFIPYEQWQIEPITRRRLGYQVYLVGTYKRSLEKHMRRNPVTHLEAVNLGIDLCAALEACRRAGFLYVDLKPSNVFITEEKDYRIGDLGFISLDTLKYTSLPDRYCSTYSPPELHDPMTTLNGTADTYALGMILYQLYNDGQLPFKDKAPEEIASPVNADYEIAEIILKAIHTDPAQRWADPKEMGQALVAYMQRNTINDTPITPHTPLVVDPEDVIQPEAPEAEADAGEAAQESPAVQDETAPSEETTEALQEYEMSDELSKIVAKADDLISHEAPEAVVVPEAPELPDPFAFIEDEEDVVDNLPPYAEEPVQEEEPPQKVKKQPSPERNRRIKSAITAVILLLILAAIGCGIFWGYQNYYLQTIDSITIDGDQSQLTVTVKTDVDPSLLTVTCTDNYGNIQSKGIEGGQVVFTDLLPGSLYKIQLEISGFHKLVGKTSDIFTTDSITSIVSFSAITGPEDGSVMLNFTVSGGEPEEWIARYSAEGEEEQQQTFSGHSVTIKGLTVGKKYTFTLEPSSEVALQGENSLEFLASRLILAENLMVTSSSGSDMTVRWSSPGDVVVDSWDVRCYSDNGYEEQLTVQDTVVYFTNIDPTVPYTIEVTASGMTQPARTSVTANPINVSNFSVDDSDPEQLTLSWDYTGATPDGGWLLMYTIDGSSTQNVVKCVEPSGVISPRVPNARYTFTIQSADGTSIFGNAQTFTTSSAQVHETQGLSADNITAHLIKTPDEEDWTFEDVGKEAYTDKFTVGDKISVVLQAGANFYVNNEDLNILYVIRDEFGNVLSEYISQDTADWLDVWYAGDYHYGELDIPKVPEEAGSYSVSIYFNGFAVTVITFSISE